MLHLFLLLLYSVTILLLILGAALGYGGAILKRLRLPQLSRGEGGLFGLGVGLATLSFLVFCVGALGLIYPVVIAALLGVGWVLLFMVGRWLWHLPVPPREAARSFFQGLRWWGLLIIIGLALGYTLVGHALLPPIDYDVIAYHFAVPKLYIQAHRLIYIPYILHSNWPFGSEMLFLISLIFQAETAAQLTTWSFTLILCSALLLFSRRWLSRETGWVAVALFASTPMLLSLAGAGMVEVPLTCYTFLAFYALWHWRETQSWGWLILSALLAGATAATKLNAASAALVFGCVALGLMLYRRQPLLRSVQVFSVYGLVSLVVVAPWYLKSWLHTGNPVWPFLYTVFGGQNWDELGSRYLMEYLQTINMAPTFTNWFTGLWHVTVARGRFGSFLIGPYLLALLPIGLLALLTQPKLRPHLTLLALMTISFYSIWFGLTQQSRFLIPMIPFALLFGASGVTWLWQQGPRVWQGAAAVGLLVWLFSGAWFFDPHHQHLWQRNLPYLLGQMDRTAFLTSVYPEYPGFLYINQTLPSNARVLLAPYEARGYYMERDYIWANTISQRYLRLEQIADAATLRKDLSQRGVTHVLIFATPNFQDIAYRAQIDQLLNDLVSQYGQLVYEVGQMRVYELIEP